VPKSQLGWLKLLHLQTVPASDCQTLSGQIPDNEPEQEIDGYGGKDFEKRRVVRRELKTA